MALLPASETETDKEREGERAAERQRDRAREVDPWGEEYTGPPQRG